MFNNGYIQGDNKMKTKFSKFELGYIECMLWSSVDDGGNPLDYKYSIEDIDSEAIKKIKSDCNLFIFKAGDLLDSIEDSQAGHDFWLTRNHHGAGFWGRGLGKIGDDLTKLSNTFGEIFPYINDNNEVDL